MDAIYRYKQYMYDDDYTVHTMRVEVLGETEKSYKIRFKEFHTNGARPGTVIWARKRNILFTDGTPAAQTGSGIKNIRLPYKD